MLHLTINIIKKDYKASVDTRKISSCTPKSLAVYILVCLTGVLKEVACIPNNTHIGHGHGKAPQKLLIWGVLCQKQISRTGTSNYTPQYLWGVITCLRPWYLLLTQHSSYDVLHIHVIYCRYEPKDTSWTNSWQTEVNKSEMGWLRHLFQGPHWFRKFY